MNTCRQDTEAVLQKSGEELSSQLKNEEEARVQALKDAADEEAAKKEADDKAAAEKAAAEEKAAKEKEAGTQPLTL